MVLQLTGIDSPFHAFLFSLLFFCFVCVCVTLEHLFEKVGTWSFDLLYARRGNAIWVMERKRARHVSENCQRPTNFPSSSKFRSSRSHHKGLSHLPLKVTPVLSLLFHCFYPRLKHLV